jgi:hypothetical protein
MSSRMRHVSDFEHIREMIVDVNHLCDGYLYPSLMRHLKVWIQVFKNKERDSQVTDDEINVILGGIAQKDINRYNDPCHFLMVS